MSVGIVQEYKIIGKRIMIIHEIKVKFINPSYFYSDYTRVDGLEVFQFYIKYIVAFFFACTS